MKSTYRVIFYLKKEKLKKDGTYPVMGRITVDGTQCQFSYKESDIEKVLTQHYKYLI